MTDLKTKTARSRLKPNLNGYAQNLATGRALIWRKRAADAPGRWILRTAKPEGGYTRETLGVADDYGDGLTYAQALETALGRTRADPNRISVDDALTAWHKGKARTASSEKHKRDNEGTARRLSKAFAGASLQTITARQIKVWMNTRVDAAKDPRPRMATVNRELGILKAALTAAAKDNDYQGTRAWSEVAKYPKAEAFGKRMTILFEHQEAELIAAADADMAVLLTALQMTGARYGEMRQVRCGDLEGSNLTFPAGKTGGRTIALSGAKAAWFAEQAGNRPAPEALLLRTDLTPWPDAGQIAPMRRAVVAAGLSREVTIYCLRHGFISRALARGVPVAAVAQFCGTSIDMIMGSYAKFVPSQMKEWFA